MKGMNSLLFVKKEDAVGPVLGGVKSAVKEGKMEFNDFPGAVVGGQLYGHLDLEVFQSTPSKMEANGMVLGSLFGPSSTLMAVLEGFCAEDSGNVDAADAPADAKDVVKKSFGEDQGGSILSALAALQISDPNYWIDSLSEKSN
uniref:Uncharacterized protein n=1 Tax=Chenopodium quinoa TaxID=63459 RepID=A0A803KX05_CHEQI